MFKILRYIPIINLYLLKQNLNQQQQQQQMDFLQRVAARFEANFRQEQERVIENEIINALQKGDKQLIYQLLNETKYIPSEKFLNVF